jgi:hypothetical protein
MPNSSVCVLISLLFTCLVCSSILKNVAINFFVTSLNFYMTTLYQVPENIMKTVRIRNITSKELYAERNISGFTGFLSSSIVPYSSQHSVSETGSVSVFR